MEKASKQMSIFEGGLFEKQKIEEFTYSFFNKEYKVVKITIKEIEGEESFIKVSGKIFPDDIDEFMRVLQEYKSLVFIQSSNLSLFERKEGA